MPILNRTEKQYAELFKTAADEHDSVNWFNYGNMEQIFAENHDLLFPAVYIQIVNATIGDGTLTRQYAIYTFDKPVIDMQVDHKAFEYDDNFVNSRDTALQILKDIVTTVKNVDRQSYTLAVTGAAQRSDKEKEGEVGWSSTFTIQQDCLI